MFNRKTKRLLKKQSKEIEDFIKWLKLFYKGSEKDKQAIMFELARTNEPLFNFMQKVKDIGEREQERLYMQLRGDDNICDF